MFVKIDSLRFDVLSFSICSFQGTCYQKAFFKLPVALENLRFSRSRAFCKCCQCPAPVIASKLANRFVPLSALSKSFRGDNEIRTRDLLLARQALSQLSYTPKVGLSGLEPPTSRLSGVRSNRLSYKPINLASTYSPVPSPAKYHRPSAS